MATEETESDQRPLALNGAQWNFVNLMDGVWKDAAWWPGELGHQEVKKCKRRRLAAPVKRPDSLKRTRTTLAGRMMANGRWLTVNDKSDKRWTQKPLIASTKEHNRHKVNPPLGFLHRHLFF